MVAVAAVAAAVAVVTPHPLGVGGWWVRMARGLGPPHPPFPWMHRTRQRRRTAMRGPGRTSAVKWPPRRPCLSGCSKWGRGITGPRRAPWHFWPPLPPSHHPLEPCPHHPVPARPSLCRRVLPRGAGPGSGAGGEGPSWSHRVRVGWEFHPVLVQCRGLGGVRE